MRNVLLWIVPLLVPDDDDDDDGDDGALENAYLFNGDLRIEMHWTINLH
jgi:hypothetical protein